MLHLASVRRHKKQRVGYWTEWFLILRFWYSCEHINFYTSLIFITKKLVPTDSLFTFSRLPIDSALTNGIYGQGCACRVVHTATYGLPFDFSKMLFNLHKTSLADNNRAPAFCTSSNHRDHNRLYPTFNCQEELGYTTRRRNFGRRSWSSTGKPPFPEKQWLLNHCDGWCEEDRSWPSNEERRYWMGWLFF